MRRLIKEILMSVITIVMIITKTIAKMITIMMK